MKVNGIIGIKSVTKGMVNGKKCYQGVAVFKIYNDEKEIRFLCNILNEKQEQFYDNYLMQPGKSGYANCTLNADQNNFYLQIEEFQFGSIKFNTGMQQNNYGQQQRYQNNYGSQQNNGGYYNQQQNSGYGFGQSNSIEISSPNDDNFNFANFNKNTKPEEETIRETVPNADFWGGMGITK